VAMTATDTNSGQLTSERVAGGILPKVLTTFDMVAIFVAIVLFITNSAAIQPAGPAAYGWWIIGFVVFLIPCAIATGQLGVMFPGEGDRSTCGRTRRSARSGVSSPGSAHGGREYW
jgi:hypothetical protein